jgi:hypothetical protein
MALNKLTSLRVARASQTGLYGDGGGLWLSVSSGGTKSWTFRYAIAGRAREMGIGPVHTISLAEARDRARDLRKLLLEGIDPLDDRRAKRAERAIANAKTLSFEECGKAYISAHRAGWKNNKHAAQWPATLEAYVYPAFGSLPVQAVDVGLVLKALEPIWSTKPETASRVRGRIESVLDWATARGYRQGENPARWRGHLDALLPAKTKVRRVEHHAALPYAEMPSFITALRQQDGIGAKALEFAILTAARTGEVIGADEPVGAAAHRVIVIGDKANPLYSDVLIEFVPIDCVPRRSGPAPSPASDKTRFSAAGSVLEKIFNFFKISNGGNITAYYRLSCMT